MAMQPAPYLLRLAAQPASAERVIWANRIPFLPDALKLARVAGLAEQEQLRVIRDAQAGVIAALLHWQQHAFALRYQFSPERGAVEVALLARADAPNGNAVASASVVDREITQQLASVDVPTAPVTTEAELRAILTPAGQIFITELRQHEELVPLRIGDAYVMFPFQPPLSSWLAVFERLMRQPAPCVINIHLQPTRLFPDEQMKFEEAASLARGLEDFQVSGYSGNIDLADPLAGVVGGLYADYARRLRNPAQLVVQVASPDPTVARAVAGVLAPEISATRDTRSALQTGQLPCGVDSVAPQSQAEAAAAYATLTQLDLQPWGATAAGPAQERLRFLVDAQTATAAFRFPIAARGLIPGVATRLGQRKIFLSYRRGDSATVTRLIHDRLAARFGKDALYLDFDNTPLGADYREHIFAAIRECAVQLVIIGPQWLSIADANGRRLDNPADVVRIEIETGLQSDATVIPLLVEGADLPTAESLPETLQTLPRLNARAIRLADLEDDMRHLIEAIEAQMLAAVQQQL